MPTYDYRCSDCGREVEVMHPIDGQGPLSCEICGGAMRKALSAPAIHFKGSGWAKKDAQTAAKSRAKTADADGSKPAADKKAGPELTGSDARSEKTTDTAKPKDGAKASASKGSKTD